VVGVRVMLVLMCRKKMKDVEMKRMCVERPFTGVTSVAESTPRLSSNSFSRGLILRDRYPRLTYLAIALLSQRSAFRNSSSGFFVSVHRFARMWMWMWREVEKKEEEKGNEERRRPWRAVCREGKSVDE
jgi:hypothetical protein